MKNTLFFYLLVAFGSIASAQSYDSAVRYRMSAPSFYAAADTLIARAVATYPADTSDGNESNELIRWKDFMGSRISLDVPLGGDMTAPMGGALSSYLTFAGSSCTGTGYTGAWQCRICKGHE